MEAAKAVWVLCKIFHAIYQDGETIMPQKERGRVQRHLWSWRKMSVNDFCFTISRRRKQMMYDCFVEYFELLSYSKNVLTDFFCFVLSEEFWNLNHLRTGIWEKRVGVMERELRHKYSAFAVQKKSENFAVEAILHFSRFYSFALEVYVTTST